MNRQAESFREWAGLILGLLGTVTGSLSLYFVWLQNSQLSENISVSVNLVRSGYESEIRKQPFGPTTAGTVTTKWQVWATNLSARETTLVGSDSFLLKEDGRFSYSGLIVGWEVEGKPQFPFPKRLEPGEVFNATLVVRYPLSKVGVDFAFEQRETEKVVSAKIDSFTRALIIATHKDVFGNPVEVKELDGGNYIFSMGTSLKDVLLAVDFTTARRNSFGSYGAWYKQYDPTN